MSYDITVLDLPLPKHMGWVNYYLTRTAAGQALIATGGSNACKELHRELASAVCTPGLLKLVIPSH